MTDAKPREIVVKATRQGNVETWSIPNFSLMASGEESIRFIEFSAYSTLLAHRDALLVDLERVSAERNEFKSRSMQFEILFNQAREIEKFNGHIGIDSLMEKDRLRKEIDKLKSALRLAAPLLKAYDDEKWREVSRVVEDVLK